MPLRIAVCQVQDVDESIAAFARQLGVTSINITTPTIPSEDGIWHVEDLVDLRRRCLDLGLTLEVVENTPHHMYDKVMLGLPGRDEQLENYRTTIRNLATAEIPMLGFHFMATSVWRTDLEAPSRGGSRVTAFDLDQVANGNEVIWPSYDGPLRLTADEVWANYEVFLDAVLPVADEVGVKLAHHPDDPPVPEIDGFARVFISPENYRRAYELSKGSPAWGVNLCLGTVSEMVGGAETVSQMIDMFGPLDKIRYVHFRDVQGTVPKFKECWLGEGNYVPHEVIAHLLSVGFSGWLQDDHVPFMDDDTRYAHRARANQIGYIQGILSTLEPR